MFRKSSLIVTLFVIAGLTLAVPFQSLTRLPSALARAVSKAPAAAPAPDTAKTRVAENYGKLRSTLKPIRASSEKKPASFRAEKATTWR